MEPTEDTKLLLGKFRGFVKKNKDPENRGRIKVVVPSILKEALTHWALPCLPFGGRPDQGWFTVPEKDALVWIEFEEGNLDKPIWTGTFWQQPHETPVETQDALPDVRMLKTASGHTLIFDDSEEEESIRIFHKAGAELNIDKNGSIVLLDVSGGKITLNAKAQKIEVKDKNGNFMIMGKQGTKIKDSNGNQLVMKGSGITVEASASLTIEGTQVQVGGAGGESIIKGQSFLSLFASHVHVSSVSGSPTSPPIPQGEFSTLSKTNTVT